MCRRLTAETDGPVRHIFNRCCLEPSRAVSYATVGESPGGRRITCRVVARNQHDEVVGVSLHIVWKAA
jgi:hypothetical protein